MEPLNAGHGPNFVDLGEEDNVTIIVFGGPVIAELDASRERIITTVKLI